MRGPRLCARDATVGSLLAAAGRIGVSIAPRDLWVGIRVSHWYVDVCPVPCVCVRVARRRRSGPPAAGSGPSVAPATLLGAAYDPFDQDEGATGTERGRLGVIRAIGS